jgi:hypothetical protein
VAWTNRKTHVGVTADMVSKWERGEKRPSALYRELLGLVLDTSPTDLGLMPRRNVGPDTQPVWEDQDTIRTQENDPVDRRTFLRGSGALGMAVIMSGPVWSWSTGDPGAVDLITGIRRAMFAPADLAPANLTALNRRVHLAWRLRQEGRYDALAMMLPALILDARAATRSTRKEKQLQAATALTHTYNATSTALKILGNTPLALVAADRAVEAAATVEHPSLTAAGAYRLANVFLPAGQTAEAADVALLAADRLQPYVGRSTVDLATWGSLTLTAATAAAQAGDTSAAWQRYGEAIAAARQLGHDHADLHTIFGPTSVAMIGVQIAVEFGDARDALRRADSVTIDHMPAALLERRAHYLMNVARGHALLRDDAGAVALLLEAERHAPGDVHRSNMSRTLVTDMLARERRGAAPGLRELADRLGVAA